MLAAILAIVATLLPVILKALYDRKAAGADTQKVLITRDVSQLRADLNKLRPGQAPPSVPQG